jgi:hypothetical protein
VPVGAMAYKMNAARIVSNRWCKAVAPTMMPCLFGAYSVPHGSADSAGRRLDPARHKMRDGDDRTWEA